MIERNYVTPTPDWTFELNEDELSYVLGLLEADVIPGLRSNSLLQMSVNEKEQATVLLRHGLLAKGYAALSLDGVWVLEPNFANLVRLLIRPAYVLSMVARPSGDLPLSMTVCFAVPDVMLSQTFPNPYAHRFGVFFATPNYAEDILSLLPTHQSDTQSIFYELSKSTARSLLDNIETGSRDQFTLVGDHQSEQLANTNATQRILAEREFSIMLSLSSLLSDTITIKHMSIVASSRGYAILFDDNPMQIDGTVRIELASRSHLADRLSVWLAPLHEVNELA